jgi:opacity protein-like surface antigen
MLFVGRDIMKAALRTVLLGICGGLAYLSGGGGESAHAEWYVAGQFGLNFADRLTDLSGTNQLIGMRGPDLDLKNSYTYGAKIGYFPGHGWFGLELDAFHSTPHIKNLDEIPGIHMRVTQVGLNLIARYPGVTFQPYAGIGTSIVIARVSGGGLVSGPNSPPTRSDSDVTSGLTLLAGIRAFVTPYVAVFTEYKYTGATLQFDQAFGAVGGFSGDYRAQHLVAGVSYHF